MSSINLEEMLEFHTEKKAKGTLALWEVDDPSRFGVVEFRENRILQFQEKPERGTELSNLINAGTYLLEPEIIELIPPKEKYQLKGISIQKLLEKIYLVFLSKDTLLMQEHQLLILKQIN